MRKYKNAGVEVYIFLSEEAIEIKNVINEIFTKKKKEKKNRPMIHICWYICKIYASAQLYYPCDIK